MDLADRLSQAIEKKRVTPYQIDSDTVVTAATISRILNRKTLKPAFKTLQIIADYLHINANWLLTGEGDMTREGCSSSNSINGSVRGNNNNISNAQHSGVGDLGSTCTTLPVNDDTYLKEIEYLNKMLAEKDKLLVEKDKIIEEKERLISILLKK